MITKAGRIAIPRSIENIIKNRITINHKAPNEYFVHPVYVNCEQSIFIAIKKLKEFASKHYSEIEIIKNEYETGVVRGIGTDTAEKGTPSLRKRKVTIRVYGALDRIIEHVLTNKNYLTIEEYRREQKKCL